MKKDYQELINLINYLITSDENFKLKLDKAIILIPEFEAFKTCLCTNSAHKHDNIFNHSLEALINVENNFRNEIFSKEEIDMIHISLLFHDIGKTVTRTFDDNGVTHFRGHPHQSALIAKNILNQYTINENYKKIIINLIENHDVLMNPVDKSEIINMINNIGIKETGMLLKIQRADLNAHADWYALKRGVTLDEIEDHYQELYNVFLSEQ